MAMELDTITCSDALELLSTLPDKSVDLIVTDPPYMGVKDEAWDNQWENPMHYVMWLCSHLVEFRRVLKPNGSLYLFASPEMSARVEIATGEYFSVLNNIRWVKEQGWHQKAEKETLRSYLSNWEGVIFAEHFNSDNYARGESSYLGALDNLRGFVFEPLRAYLEGERKKAGISFEQVRQIVGCARGSGLPSHWFTRSQWILPTEEQYTKLQRGFNNGSMQYLRREYEYLRREYEDLRREFNSSEFDANTDTWTFDTVQFYEGKHPCEKPLSMLRHILKVSSREGDVILDPFCGSGATLDAARQMGRRYIGGDSSQHWATYARKRLALPYTVSMFTD